jgi:hypothetical protein
MNPHLRFDIERVGHCSLAKLVRDNFSAPLEIKIDEHKCIAIVNWDSSHHFDAGIVILHGQGEMEIGRNSPTYREYLDVPPELDPEYDYVAIAELAIQSLAEEPWLEELEPEANDERKSAALRAWLGERMPPDWEAAFEWLFDNILTQYTPGFELAGCLSKSDKEQFGVKIVDLGGPVSSVPAVRFLGSVEDLNMLLNKARLPYVAMKPTRR